MLTSLTLALLFNPFASAEGLAWTCHDAVYELCAVGDTLFARTSGGVLAITTDRVRTAVSMPPHVRVEKPNVKGDGAFLSAVTDYNEGKLASWWGGKFIYKLEGNTLIPFAPRPPASGDYSLLMHAGILYAGTNDGLHAYAIQTLRLDELAQAERHHFETPHRQILRLPLAQLAGLTPPAATPLAPMLKAD